MKEETEDLLEAGLIEKSMSPYATPIIVVPRKANQEHPSRNKETNNRLP